MKIYLILLVLLIFIGCKKDGKEINTISSSNEIETIKLSSNRPDLNISILLDLSDRINPEKFPMPAMEFYERDLGYINSISNNFELHLRNKRSSKINDRIQLYIDPEPADKNLNEKLKYLKLNFTRENAKKEFILKTSQKYDSISRLIYESALQDNKYVGSNIWGFFKSRVKDYCIEENHKNLLIILTDGYTYHQDNIIREGNLTTYITPQDIRSFNLDKKDWENKFKEKGYGFIPATNDLQNLEILVLGINPDPKNPYEEDVIIKYWSDWFNQMGVGRYEIKSAGLPSDMEKIIREFILNE